MPDRYVLGQNYPNPFNSSTVIRYALPEGGLVRLEIYNVLGQRVRVLVDGEQEAGYHMVRWDGKDDMGEMVANGVYLYRIEAGEFVNSKKMLLLK